MKLSFMTMMWHEAFVRTMRTKINIIYCKLCFCYSSFLAQGNFVAYFIYAESYDDVDC